MNFLSLFDFQQKVNYKTEVLSGLTVAIALIPEAIAFAIIEALNKITQRYLKLGKKVKIKHLSPDCHKLLKNADEIIQVNVIEDPNYKVMMD